MEDLSKRGILKTALAAALLSQLTSAQSANPPVPAGATTPPTPPKDGNSQQKVAYRATSKRLDEANLMEDIERLRTKNASKEPHNTAKSFNEAKIGRDKVDQETEKLAAELRNTKAELPNPTLGFAFTFQRTGQHFSPIRFDLIASQATALLQRCFQTRQEWQQQYQTMTDFYYDLETFEKLDAIHRLEEKAGYYELDEQQSATDLDAANVLRSANKLAADVLEFTQNDIRQNFNEYYGWSQLVGWLSHISGYQKGAADNTVTWNQVQKTVIEYSLEAAAAQGELGLRSALHQLESDRAIKKGQANALDQKHPSLTARLAWDRKNTNFRKLRTQVLRELYKRKQQLVDESSGPLNYRVRLERLGNSYGKDLSAALERLPQIAQGFHVLVGYNVPLPASCTSAVSNPNIKPNESVLDDANEWLRAAGNWYIKFLETEQLGTLVLSVRHTISQPDWVAFLNGSDLTIEVTEGMLPNQRHARLRAVSLYTEESRRGWFAAKITCPLESVCLHLSGSKHAISQREIPALRAGRIDSATSTRPPERLGTNAAYNASPLGNWGISLSEVGIPASERSSMTDLFVEIIYAYQEAR